MKVFDAFEGIAMFRGIPKLTSLKSQTAVFRRGVLIMKLTGIIILAACLQVSAKGLSQTVTLSEKNAPLQKVITEIERQTKYSFFYKTTWLEKAQKVTIEVKSRPLYEVLELCFKDQPLTYTIIDNVITIAPKINETPKQGNQLLPIDVSGRVLDKEGNPLIGANVKVNGTDIGTTTDNEGKFRLNNVDENAVLEISYVGFETQIISIQGKPSVLIRLNSKNSLLDETVVIAYGTTTRRLNTGNVASVKAADIEKQAISNPLLALQGRVPGLLITQFNGVPGGAIQVRIQGQNSIFNGNAPLYIIDGVPFPTEIPTAGINFGPLGTSGEQVIRGGVIGTGNALSFINPSDIESIEVLKDADATAIYGSRAANGAILITTKKGKPGKTKLELNLQQGWGKVTRTMDMLNLRQYLDMRYEALKNDGLIPSSNPSASTPFVYAPDLTIWDTTRYTDWKEVLIGGTARYTNINANVTGGNNAIQYRVGGTYNKQTTVFPGDYADSKGTVSLDLNNNSSTQKFKFRIASSYTTDDNQLPNVDLTQAALLLAPNAPEIYNEDGTLNWAPNSLGTSTWINPLGAALYKTYQAKTNSLISNANLSYRILPNLQVGSNFGYTNISTKDYQLNSLLAEKPENRPNMARTAWYGNRNISTWIVEPQANYKLLLGRYKIELLGGATFQQTATDAGYIAGSGYNNDQVLKNPSAAGTLSPYAQVTSLYRYNAFFGRVNFNLLDKYVINLTGRRDGTSRFGEQSRFHNFAGIGAAWIFSQESYLQNLKFLSFGKLKASYGTNGSDQIGDYRFLSLYNIVNSSINYQNNTGLSPGDIPNPYLEWEETKKFSAGIELGFFKDRIYITGNYARNRTSNQLMDYRLPNTTGRSTVLKNFPATLQNTSLEFTLTTANIKKANFNWTTNFNLTIPRNKLVDFPNLESSSYASSYFIGEPINTQRAYHFLGVDPATGVYLVADKNGNPTTSPKFPDDATILISSFAKYYGGIQNTIQYKSIQLDFLFQFVKQSGAAGFFSNSQTFTPGRFSTFSGNANQPAAIINESHWQKPGDNAIIQRYSTNSNLESGIGTVIGSDANFKEATFGRLKNLSLSWEIPSKWKQKAHFQNFRFYLNGQNLWTITKYKGQDPENQSFTTLPPLRILTVGLQVTL